MDENKRIIEETRCRIEEIADGEVDCAGCEFVQFPNVKGICISIYDGLGYNIKCDKRHRHIKIDPIAEIILKVAEEEDTLEVLYPFDIIV